MNSGCRHKQQRSSRVRLKADAAYLLLKIEREAILNPDIEDAVREMIVRLQPKPGIAAPIILTAYTKESNT